MVFSKSSHCRKCVCVFSLISRVVFNLQLQQVDSETPGLDHCGDGVDMCVDHGQPQEGLADTSGVACVFNRCCQR